MSTPLNSTSAPSRETVFLQLSKPDSGVSTVLRRLLQSAPMPMDGACLSLVCKGAKMVVDAAFTLIPDLNDAGKRLKGDLDLLAIECARLYGERNVVESSSTLKGRKTLFPGWVTLTYLAETSTDLATGRLIACGMELALKLITNDRKLVAEEHMRQLVQGQIDFDIDGDEFIKAVYFEKMGLADLLPWFARAKRNYFRFRTAFCLNPPPPPPPPTLKERAVAQWKAHAAYPNFKHRAGVLDKTALSELQIIHATHIGMSTGFTERPAYQATLWFAGFSGLNFSTIADIPFRGRQCSNWVICIDLETGLLLRDFSCLVPSLAKASKSEHCIPSTFVLDTPMPEHVLAFLKKRLLDFPAALTLSDLIPEILHILSTQLLYRSTGDILPTWARLARTVGRYMRRQGIDSLLASLVSGNFGNSGKSKLHYCCVGAEEIWIACSKIYKILKFGEPVTMPAGSLHFGSSIVPRLEQVAKIDLDNLELLEALRPPGKCSAESLFIFHNCYVTALGFRICCLLGLREANPLALLASLDERVDATVDIDDKSTPDRPGALPVILIEHLKTLLKLYRLHCLAIRQRLKNKPEFSDVAQWLGDVVQHRTGYLLCQMCDASQSLLPLSTSMVLPDNEIAVDFGRKIMENYLRTEGAMSRDIDRTLRHEVLGQESYSSVTDDSEVAWIQRVSPKLDALALRLFPNPLFGLRRPS